MNPKIVDFPKSRGKISSLLNH